MTTLRVDPAMVSKYRRARKGQDSRWLVNQLFLHQMFVLGCRNGTLDEIETFLQSIDDPNQCDPLGKPPLNTAARHGRADVVRMMTQRDDVDVNVTSDWLQSPLHVACKRGHVHVVTELLSRPDIQVNVRNQRSSTPLFEAVRSDKADVVRLMVQRSDVNVNIENTLRLTALSIAICQGLDEVLRVLLTRGDLNVCIYADEEESYLGGTFVWQRLDYARLLLRHKNMTMDLPFVIHPVRTAANEGLEFLSVMLRHVKVREIKRVYLTGVRREATRGKRMRWIQRKFRGQALCGVRRRRIL